MAPLLEQQGQSCSRDAVTPKAQNVHYLALHCGVADPCIGLSMEKIEQKIVVRVPSQTIKSELQRGVVSCPKNQCFENIPVK